MYVCVNIYIYIYIYLHTYYTYNISVAVTTALESRNTEGIQTTTSLPRLLHLTLQRHVLLLEVVDLGSVASATGQLKSSWRLAPGTMCHVWVRRSMDGYGFADWYRVFLLKVF